MRRKRVFTAIALAAIAIASATLAAAPGFPLLRGLSLDVATALRWRVFGDAHEARSSPTAVIALDEETVRTPPFKGTPIVAWTGELGRVLGAVLNGGAKVVGFDVIFPTTIEDSDIAFGDGTIGERMRGFDRDFLRALAAGAAENKVVLGAIRTSDDLILPAAGQRAAVGQMRNVRFLNVYGDADGIVRRAPLVVSVNGRLAPTMSLELASRALSAQPNVASGGVELGGYAIPSFIPNAVTLNFDGGTGDIPSYSLSDLLACVDRGDPEFFRRNFAGRIVLFGSKLDLEDRKLTSKRFASVPRPAVAERCVGAPPSTSQSAGGLIDGVFVQATAVNNLMRREAVVELGDGPRWLIALAGAAIESLAAFTLAPVGVAVSLALLCAAAATAAAVALHALIALPVVEVCLAGVFAVVATTAFRLFVTDKDKRLLRRNFELYLAPAVVERIANSDRPPQLGGEQREVTIFFSDLVKFSTLAETRSPQDVVHIMNRYLTAMSDVIEAHGGFIDKYIGDAILAVFGAPLDEPRHAERAVHAALACCARLDALNAESRTEAAPPLAHRIGLNSGPAVVGNIGSKRRFNYTVMGDAVNLASRLEGANKVFGTSVMASEATVALAGLDFVWRELDLIRVKGRGETVRVFEPLALSSEETQDVAERLARYRKGLALWRAGDFAAAASALAPVADVDPPSRKLIERARAMAKERPPDEWVPVFALE
ncbi:MAG TPA: adenylate/guanylate cyclase domain-containing protein [Roseiarcus sp.]|nr:adenylate/guanylate cyclase domain-containing protein [Roseiarcus sp.]